MHSKNNFRKYRRLHLIQLLSAQTEYYTECEKSLETPE